jgi:hypothetical protein
MTKQEFIDKHGEFQPVELFGTYDVIRRISSNLSDLHIEKEFFTSEEMDNKLNAIKQYMWDYAAVMLEEERQKRYEEQEMKEFNAHLGRI